MIKLGFLFLITAMFNVSCNSENTSKNIISSKIDRNDTMPDSKKYFDTITYQNYCLKISSIKIDLREISDEDKKRFYYPNLMHKQSFYLYKNDRLIRNMELPTSETMVRSKSNRNIGIKDHTVVSLGVIQGKKDFVFSIEGFAGCNSCESFFILVDKNGTIRAFEYYDAQKNSRYQINSIKDCLNNIDFSIVDFEEGKYRQNNLIDPIKEFW